MGEEGEENIVPEHLDEFPSPVDEDGLPTIGPRNGLHAKIVIKKNCGYLADASTMFNSYADYLNKDLRFSNVEGLVPSDIVIPAFSQGANTGFCNREILVSTQFVDHFYNSKEFDADLTEKMNKLKSGKITVKKGWFSRDWVIAEKKPGGGKKKKKKGDEDELD